MQQEHQEMTSPSMTLCDVICSVGSIGCTLAERVGLLSFTVPGDQPEHLVQRKHQRSGEWAGART
jgi:hypothetical protein